MHLAQNKRRTLLIKHQKLSTEKSLSPRETSLTGLPTWQSPKVSEVEAEQMECFCRIFSFCEERPPLQVRQGFKEVSVVTSKKGSKKNRGDKKARLTCLLVVLCDNSRAAHPSTSTILDKSDFHGKIFDAFHVIIGHDYI